MRTAPTSRWPRYWFRLLRRGWTKSTEAFSGILTRTREALCIYQESPGRRWSCPIAAGTARAAPALNPVEATLCIVSDESHRYALQLRRFQLPRPPQHYSKFVSYNIRSGSMSRISVFVRQRPQNEAEKRSGVSVMRTEADSELRLIEVAYGQTGSGKTYTMEGLNYELVGDRPRIASNLDESNRSLGIVPRAIRYMYSRVAADEQRTYQISLSYLQIYNERIYDLLDIDNR
ncbi:unnamed protein product [Sphagnum jensenii]